MMISLAPLKYRGWRLFTGLKTYQDLCDQQWILCPGEQVMLPSAIYREGELEKVTGVQEDTTLNLELQRIQGGLREIPGSIAYRLRDVQIHHGYVYKKAMKLTLTVAKESFFASEEAEYFSNAALVSTYCSNRYFAHWMTDYLTLVIAAQPLAKVLRTAQKTTQHQEEYGYLLNLNSTPVTQAYCKELIWFDDCGQNRLKRERYDQIRSKLRTLAPHE
ncbi:MAG: glycosyltransferase family 61 protein, partial [Leptolyngbyaceae cyanobacterium bins.59]|nr:glycosyltransferase family 61 protein [Leptolyngbyaceae cyanobacterium bins.59]